MVIIIYKVHKHNDELNFHGRQLNYKDLRGVIAISYCLHVGITVSYPEVVYIPVWMTRDMPVIN